MSMMAFAAAVEVDPKAALRWLDRILPDVRFGH